MMNLTLISCLCLWVLVSCLKGTLCQYQYPEVSEAQLPDYYEDIVAPDVIILKDLLKNLLTDYDTRIRPIFNQSASIKVASRFYPMSLIEFDTAEQRFSILGYFVVRWTDEFLIWDKNLYGDTNNVKFPISYVWNPSLIILKAYNGDGTIGSQNVDIVKVHDDGAVFWVPEGIFSVVCQVDIKYYPFDEQACVMTYYVADETIHSGVILDHELDVSLEHFTQNSAWDMVDITKFPYTRFESRFIDITFTLRRRANFTIFTLIMPLLMLAFLNIAVFLVPICSGEKGGFAITIFLSYGIFVTMVSDTLPHNSLQVSLFVLFITVLLLISVMSVFYTIVQAKLMASIGDKECPWRCFGGRNTRRNRTVPVQPMPTQGEEEAPAVDPEKAAFEDRSDDESYTWAMFLERLDTIIFIVFLALILITTAAVFYVMLRRDTEDKFKKA